MLAREYIAALGPVQIESLREECHLIALETEADLRSCALLLAKHAGQGEPARLAYRVLDFLTALLERMAQLPAR